MFDTLTWDQENRILKLLDQRLLPGQVIYRRYRRASEVARAIKNMVVRGAPAIGITGAFGLTLEAFQYSRKKPQTGGSEFWETMHAAYRELLSSRPTAVNLAWALDHLWQQTENDMLPSEVAQLWENASIKLLEDDVTTNREIGEKGAGLLGGGSCVYTHCNAGALATAGWGTALGVIRSAFRQNKISMVYAGETRPYLQGARLTVFELLTDEIPVTLVTDNSAGYLMQTKCIDAVIVGADRVAANGDTANKIGTYSLAVLANHHVIPFYVAAPVATLDLNIPDGSRIVIEERDPAEITCLGKQRLAPSCSAAYNPSFDVTPASLISGIITEKGVIAYPETPGNYFKS